MHGIFEIRKNNNDLERGNYCYGKRNGLFFHIYPDESREVCNYTDGKKVGISKRKYINGTEERNFYDATGTKIDKNGGKLENGDFEYGNYKDNQRHGLF